MSIKSIVRSPLRQLVRSPLDEKPSGGSTASLTTTLTYTGSLPVGVPTPTSVANWNTAFGGTTYASVGVAGLVVTLTGPVGQVLLNNAGVRTAAVGLVSVVDTGAVSAIGDASFVNSPFEAATSLTTLTLPACTSVGENSCLGSGLTSINLPACLTLGDSAFLQCASLGTVSLPACTSVGLNSLQECTSLTTLTLPSCLTVGVVGLAGCTGLTSVSLPVATFLDASAMEGNTALTTISIPACTNLGGTTGDDLVFDLIAGNTITLTVKTATATDGDVLALQAANTVTLILV